MPPFASNCWSAPADTRFIEKPLILTASRPSSPRMETSQVMISRRSQSFAAEHDVTYDLSRNRRVNCQAFVDERQIIAIAEKLNEAGGDVEQRGV